MATSTLIKMMIDSQKQEAAAGATAYQARGDLTIHNGATPEQIAEIIGAITRQLHHFTAEARAVAEERCQELRQEILEEMAKPEFSDRSQAFRDPDFQYCLSSALNEFARKGDEDLKKELVGLLLERAKNDPSQRIGMVLNQAIQTTPKLTKEDKAVLVALFVIKNVFITSSAIQPVYGRYQLMLYGSVDGLTAKAGSFDYLQSIGCINVNLVADHFPLDQHFHRQYGNLFPKKNIPAPQVPNQVAPMAHEIPASPQEVWEGFLASVPAIKTLNEVWMEAHYRHSTPTAVGKAIAHGILVGQNKMDAPLEVFLT